MKTRKLTDFELLAVKLGLAHLLKNQSVFKGLGLAKIKALAEDVEHSVEMQVKLPQDAQMRGPQ